MGVNEISEDYRRVTGRTCESRDRERQTFVATEGNSSSKVSDVMQEAVRRENLKQALKRVCANKGAEGVDGSHIIMQKKLTGSTITVPVPDHNEIRI